MTVVKDTYHINHEDIDILVQIDTNISQSSTSFGNMRDGTKIEKVLSQTDDIFNKGLVLARNCATVTFNNMRKLPADICPDEFELQLAIKLDGEIGAYLVKLGGEAQMQVSMKWIHKK
jgi:hypothetical protein